MNDTAPAVIIGAGPSGLIAADVLSAAGRRVIVCERMPSVGRKFLMAGRGGLNLTHSEPLDRFPTRYGAAQTQLAPMLDAFPPSALIAWAEELGQPTFAGSSGRVFPKAMKASPLLRALLQRLAERGVEIRTRMRWTGWDEHGALAFTRDGGSRETLRANTTLLALGGASWPKLGADGSWAEMLAARGVALTPFKPSNMGVEIAWSPIFRERFAGEPLKGIALDFNGHALRGEAMVAHYGLEGGAIYALSSAIRDALAHGPAALSIDLRPDVSAEDIATKLARAKQGDSLSSTLRKALGLSPAAINLLRENGQPPSEPHALAALIKAVPLAITGTRGLDRAISSAGGVAWNAVNENLELRALPGVYVAGEMLDWEAPTGGYLLQASFATGVYAARAMLERGSSLAASGGG